MSLDNQEFKNTGLVLKIEVDSASTQLPYDGDVQRIFRCIYLHHTSKLSEHNAKYSGNKVYQIMILVIGEIES